MQQRRLGRTELSIPALGLGCTTFGREIDEQTSFQIMDHALEHGLTLFDTAESYGGGNARRNHRGSSGTDQERVVSDEMHSSERIIGRWLRKRKCRDQIVVCTKVGPGNDPQNITRAVRDCCDRLGVETIDLFMLHVWDEAVPIDESLDALTQQVRAGNVRAVGCSNFTGQQLAASLQCSEQNGFARFEAIENIYNLVNTTAEQDVFSVCAQHEVSFVSYSPLGAGFLTGKYTPNRNQLPHGSRFDVIPGHCEIYFSSHSFRMVEQLRQKSEEMGQPMALLAAAWVTSCPHVSCVLFGARKLAHLDNAISALKQGIDPRLRQELQKLRPV